MQKAFLFLLKYVKIYYILEEFYVQEFEEIELQKEFIEKVKDINIEKKLKYHILTMGCSLNENDSEKICGMLEKMNYTETSNISEANFIIFNTCCIRENAEDRLFGKLGEVKKLKEQNIIPYIFFI